MIEVEPIEGHELLDEVRQIDPRLYELAVERVTNRHLMDAIDRANELSGIEAPEGPQDVPRE